MTTPLRHCPACGFVTRDASDYEVRSHRCPARPLTRLMATIQAARERDVAAGKSTLEPKAVNPTAEQCPGSVEVPARAEHGTAVRPV